MNFLMDYWSEYYKVADYLLNRILIKWFNWKILFKIINNIKSNLNYIHIYKTKAYVLRNKIFYKDQLKPYIYISFLIGYDSHNIYHIWLPSSKHIIHTKDIIFIKDKFYKSDKLDLRFVEDIKKIIKYFKILLSRSVSEQKKLDSDEKILPYVYN